MNNDNGTIIVKNKISSFEWYVPHFTPSIPQKTVFFKQFLIKTPTEPQYVERKGLMKEANTQRVWTLELGAQGDINVPKWIIVFFQQRERERQNSQNLNKDTFYRPPVTNAQCHIRTEKIPDSASLINYGGDNYSHGYGQKKDFFELLAKDDILNP